MKPYGLPDHEWRDEYAPTTNNDHGAPMRSKSKRELRRLAKRQKRAKGKREIEDQIDEIDEIE